MGEAYFQIFLKFSGDRFVCQEYDFGRPGGCPGEFLPGREWQERYPEDRTHTPAISCFRCVRGVGDEKGTIHTLAGMHSMSGTPA